MKHIEFPTFLDWFEKRLSIVTEAEIREHVSICSECAAVSSQLADFFSVATTDHREQVPQAVTARILNIFQRRRAIPEPEPKAVFGSGFLIFDDWSLAMNERFSGIDSRQLLFRVNDFDIDLRIDLCGDTCRLTGQILPGYDGGTISIESRGFSATTNINETGEFEFEELPPGDYTLIAGPNNEIVLNQVPIHR